MKINHRITSLVFAFSIGLLVSYCSYQWITNTDRAAQRAVEEGVVLESRRILTAYIDSGDDLEISDPLSRVREAGKVYIYPVAGGWEISGQYRRTGESGWHEYLMSLDQNAGLLSLMVDDADPGLKERAASDPKLSITARN